MTEMLTYMYCLVDKYVGLCLGNYYDKANFYLQVCLKPNPAVWYACPSDGS